VAELPHQRSADERRTAEFLLKEYDAAKELTFHIDELRAKLTSYFIALSGLALTALSLLFSSAEKSNPDEELIRWTVAFAFFGVGVVGAVVVRIIARLRRAQLESFRIMNNIREHFLGDDVKLWNVVELSRETLPEPTRKSGSYLWVLAIQLLSTVGLGFGLYIFVSPLTDWVGRNVGIAIAGIIAVAFFRWLDLTYLRRARPPSAPEYKKSPRCTPTAKGALVTKELNCRDVGFDCEGVIRADSEEEVVAQATMHAREVHGLQQIDAETEQKIRSVIHDA
jgi:predicted small metal-binding protein